MGEFTIEPILTPGELDLACWFLLRTIPSLEARWRGPGFFHERLARESPMMLAAKREDEIAGVVLGHVDGDRLGTVDHLAVAAAVRGGGLGRGLLSALESEARGLGVQQLTLGSIEGAVGFYERCGYQGRLLLQFASPERVRGRDGVHAQWVMDKNLDAPAVLSLGLARQRRRSRTPRHEVDCAIDSMRAG